MSWAKHAKEALANGQIAIIKPRGHSMRGKIESGTVVEVSPCNPDDLNVGDIVLVHINGRDYLHLIKAIQGKRFQIGNNRGGINGWVGPKAIYGIVTKIGEDDA